MIDSSTNGAIQFGIHIQKHKLLSILCIREGSGNPLQYSCLATPMDRERSLVGCSPGGREDSDTTEQLHFHFSLSCIGEGNSNHSNILAWRIPGTEEPSGLPSMGSHRVGND